MRSRDHRLRTFLLCLLAGLLLWPGPAASARQPAPPPIDDRDVAQAVERVRADPNLSGTRTVRTLRWRSSEQTRSPTAAWLRDLFGVFAESGRLLMWVGIIGLGVLLALYLVRMLPGQLAAAGNTPDRVTPTHVRDLDIRPESLPEDVGAAARTLWDAGQRRAALALLYRGLLSRLAHTYRVPIRDSSTEGDCLSLASSRVEPSTFAYAHRLVGAWQQSVYGGLEADTAVVHDLCAGFGPTLDPRARPAAAAGGRV